MARKKLETLSEQMYYVLLVLREEMCGSQIVEAILTLTNQRVHLGPGTLYTILAQFEEAMVIKETKVEGRKRSYQISEEGNRLLLSEYKRLLQMIADSDRWVNNYDEKEDCTI